VNQGRCDEEKEAIKRHLIIMTDFTNELKANNEGHFSFAKEPDKCNACNGMLVYTGEIDNDFFKIVSYTCHCGQFCHMRSVVKMPIKNFNMTLGL
jgi:hypothetical protein